MFTLPQLPYDYSALEPWIDTETMHLHHDKHHQAYVDNLNKALEGHDNFLTMPISELVTNLDQIPEDIRMKVRNNGGGHFNHSLFWSMLSPKPTQPDATLLKELTTTFGSMEKFQESFNAKGLVRFGSGWVWLIREDGVLKIEDTPNQDNPLMRNKNLTIILGLDVWEHAYYLKYQNKRADYLKNWWQVANWLTPQTI